MKDKTFYGPLQVEFATDIDGNMVEIQCVGGQKEVVTKKTFALSITQDKKDYNYLQEVKIKAIMEEIMAVILSYDVKMYEVNALLSAIGKNIKERYTRAINYLWTGDDKNHVAGSDPTDYFSVLEAEKIITKIPPKANEVKSK